MLNRLLFFFVSVFFISILTAQENGSNNLARWLQDPAISPDGKSILFGYQGNIYKVGSEGGTAIPLTVGDDYKKRPVWSNDGKTIAYASDLYGNFDVFVMPAEGGKATRITYHSAGDTPYDFTPDDSLVLIGSHREAPASSVRFPGIRYFANMYTVPVEGGRPVLVSTAGAEHGHYNKEGNNIAFQDAKGYEDYYRKHHTSAVTRDIWIYDINEDSYRQVSTYKGENRNPSFSNDGNSVFYTHERDGTLNIYKQSLVTGEEKQLTFFSDFPVRGLSLSSDDVMTFTWKGDIYTLEEDGELNKLDVKVLTNTGINVVKQVSAGRLTGFKLSPDGKEIAFVSRGEVFVTGVDNKQTKRITDTPQQERMVNWSPDGKTLIFSGERGDSWDIYKATLKYPEEKYFYAATTIEVEELVATEAEEFLAKYSPDGKKIAYIENRNILKVMELETGGKVTVLPEGRNFSYRDGDWSFAWSPDSRWLLVDDSKGYFTVTNTALIPADGKGEIIHPVNGGFGESGAKWAMNGKVMTYKSSKLGRKSLAYQGSYESDIYAVFFDVEAYDEYILSEDEYKLKMDRKEEDEEEESEDDLDNLDKETKKKEEVEPLEFNLENLRERIVRLTINSASISDYVLNKDGSKLYYLAQFEKGYDLWETEPRTRKTKILAKLGGSYSSLELSKDEKYLFLSDKGSLKRITIKDGKVKSIPTNAKMHLDPAEERQYIYDHIWRQVADKFYDPEIHGIDWKMYYDAYAEFLPHINNNYDYQIMLSELLGELNASHTGARYYPSGKDADVTAAFGLLYDESYLGEGIKIDEVIMGGPLDKAEIDVRPGDLLIKINDNAIAAEDNWNKYLNNLVGKNTLLIFSREGKTFRYTIKPISLSAQNNLMYKRWIMTMERMTDSLSGGQLGYVHTGYERQ